jgi:hypothetical protein
VDEDRLNRLTELAQRVWPGDDLEVKSRGGAEELRERAKGET